MSGADYGKLRDALNALNGAGDGSVENPTPPETEAGMSQPA